jgi:hypothetical protein
VSKGAETQPLTLNRSRATVPATDPCNLNPAFSCSPGTKRAVLRDSMAKNKRSSPFDFDRCPTPRTKICPWGPRFAAIFAQGRHSATPLAMKLREAPLRMTIKSAFQQK